MVTDVTGNCPRCQSPLVQSELGFITCSNLGPSHYWHWHAVTDVTRNQPRGVMPSGTYRSRVIAALWRLLR